MNTYSQTKVNGVAMPFIMGCTKPSPIEALEEGDEKVIYDPMTQSTVVDMRIIGTRSLRCHTTQKKSTTKGSKSMVNCSDKKNEIDDSKNVK